MLALRMVIQVSGQDGVHISIQDTDITTNS